MIKAVIDPLMFPWAETYFLEGLMKVINGRGGRILFDNGPFAGIDDYQRGIHTFNFIIEDEQGNDTKYAIDWADQKRKYYEEWCSPESAMRLIGL